MMKYAYSLTLRTRPSKKRELADRGRADDALEAADILTAAGDAEHRVRGHHADLSHAKQLSTEKAEGSVLGCINQVNFGPSPKKNPRKNCFL